MSISFDEPTYPSVQSSRKKPSFLARLVIRLGLARDEQGAQAPLLILAVIIFVLAFSVLFVWSSFFVPEPTLEQPRAFIE